jgi:hypothetical protein
MVSKSKTCLICNAVLSFHREQMGKLCGNVHCQRKYAFLLPHQICAACGRPLSLRELGGKFCANAECLRDVLKERERQQAEGLREEVRRLREQGARTVGISAPESYPLTIIPSFAASVVILPEPRRRAFRDHVTLLISQATAEPGPPSHGASAQAASSTPVSITLPAVQAVLGRACTQCQGRCCARGGDHAYLTLSTVSRYLKAHPKLRPRDVLAAYLASVGDKTFENSCIFHQPGGCSLPRAMRSDTCNDYFCEGLKEFQRNHRNTRPVRGFVASTKDYAVRNAAFVDEFEARDVPVPA